MKKTNVVSLSPAPDPNATLQAHASTLQKATDFKAATAEDYAHGGTLLKMLTAAEKEYKAKEDTALVPAKAAVDAIKELFNPGREKLAACKKNIKDEMDSYRAKELSRQEKERQRILSDSRTKAETKEVKLQSIFTPALGNTRKVRTLVVTDPKGVPWEFLEVNESALKKWLLEGNRCKGAHLENETITVS